MASLKKPQGRDNRWSQFARFMGYWLGLSLVFSGLLLHQIFDASYAQSILVAVLCLVAALFIAYVDFGDGDEDVDSRSDNRKSSAVDFHQRNG